MDSCNLLLACMIKNTSLGCQVCGDRENRSWKPVFAAVTMTDFLLYDAVPSNYEEWTSAAIQRHAIIATRSTGCKLYWLQCYFSSENFILILISVLISNFSLQFNISAAQANYRPSSYEESCSQSVHLVITVVCYCHSNSLFIQF